MERSRLDFGIFQSWKTRKGKGEEECSVKSSIEFLPSRDFILFSSFFYDSYELLTIREICSRSFILSPTKPQFSFILFSLARCRTSRNHFKISSSFEVEMKFSPYPGRKSSEETNRPRSLPISQFPLRRKKNRGCVRGYGIPAFRLPQCATTPLIIMGKVARKENVHLCLFSYPHDKLHPRVLLFFFFFFLLLDLSSFSLSLFLLPFVASQQASRNFSLPLLINISRAAYHRLLANCDTSSRGSQSAWRSK